ncbi:MAG: crossover junction endodeoxyribonuclease RuvC [Thermoanaerobaculia bacterium]
MRILGVDPGSRAAGWAVVEFTAAPRLAAAGVLRPPASLPFAERLAFLHHALGVIITREAPQAAVVERVFAGVNAQSLIALGEARGVLLLALAEAGIPAAEITPAEVKRAVAGTGSAEKEQVRRMVASLLGRRLALDAADAAAAALAHGFVVARRGATRGPEALTAAARVVVRRPAG